MNIFYDHQIFSKQIYGGISKYHIELIKALNTYKSLSVTLSCKYSNNKNLIDSGLNISKPFVPGLEIKGKTKFINLINKLYSIEYLKKNNYDIIHPTYYDDYILKIKSGSPLIITCHDLIPEKYSSYFEQKKLIPELNSKKRLINRADKIIAVSNNTKKDIIDYYNIHPSKIEVVHLAFSNSSNISNKIFSFPNNYLLFVGNRYGYKNFHLLINSLEGIFNKEKDLFLICAGGGQFTRNELSDFKSMNILDKIIYADLNIYDINSLYKNAIAVVLPSIYEGFGLPILEAFNNNCPVLLSNKSSFPEIAVDNALYFDPTEKDSIANAISKILNDSELRSELILRGLIRAKDFSWSKTGLETLNVYKEVAN